MNPIVEAVIDWLSHTTNARAADDITADSELIARGILNSIEILNLVSFLEEHFGIALPIDEFVPENFESPRAIANLVVRLSSALAAD